MAPTPRWWEARRAQSLKPATYRCPLCGGQLPAMSDHILLFPEGDHDRRRHAHRDCVLAARGRGELPTRSEWEAATRAAAAAGGAPAAPRGWRRFWPGRTARMRG